MSDENDTELGDYVRLTQLSDDLGLQRVSDVGEHDIERVGRYHTRKLASAIEILSTLHWTDIHVFMVESGEEDITNRALLITPGRDHGLLDGHEQAGIMVAPADNRDEPPVDKDPLLDGGDEIDE